MTANPPRAPWFRHPVAASLVGVFAGGLVIALVEWLAHQGLGPADPMQPGSIRPAMFAAVLGAWIAGAAAAGLVATAWCGGRRFLPGLVAGGVLFAGSVATMAAFPHPGWVMAAAVLAMPAATWLAARSRLATGARPGTSA